MTGLPCALLVDAYPRGHLAFGFHADISPNGNRIVYSTCEFSSGGGTLGRYEIAVLDLRSGDQERLTYRSNVAHYPVWSPDGTRIAFIRVPVGGSNNLDARLYTMAADGSDVLNVVSTLPVYLDRHTMWQTLQPMGEEDEAKLAIGGIAFFPPAWSPDGKKLAFLVYEEAYVPYRKILYTVGADGTRLTRIAVDALSAASWSPDGQRLAVAKYAGDDVALFVLAADGSDRKRIATITDPTDI